MWYIIHKILKKFQDNFTNKNWVKDIPFENNKWITILTSTEIKYEYIDWLRINKKLEEKWIPFNKKETPTETWGNNDMELIYVELPKSVTKYGQNYLSTHVEDANTKLEVFEIQWRPKSSEKSYTNMIFLISK